MHAYGPYIIKFKASALICTYTSSAYKCMRTDHIIPFKPSGFNILCTYISSAYKCMRTELILSNSNHPLVNYMYLRFKCVQMHAYGANIIHPSPSLLLSNHKYQSTPTQINQPLNQSTFQSINQSIEQGIFAASVRIWVASLLRNLLPPPLLSLGFNLVKELFTPPPLSLRLKKRNGL